MAERPKIADWLDDQAARYRVFHFRKPVYTVAESQAETGLAAEQILKSMLLVDARGKFAMFCLPGDKKIDGKKARAAAGFASKSRFATPEEVEKVLNQKVGAVTALLSVGKAPIYFDQSVKQHDEVSLSAGEFEYEIIITVDDLVRLVKPVFADVVQ